MTRNPWKYLFLIFAVSCVEQSAAQIVTLPEDQEITLVGTIREVHGFGPPGYGEDKKLDSKIKYWALELPNPITTPCTPERPEWESSDCASAKHFHIYFNELLERKARAAKNRKMVVKGTLHRSETAGEITPIYMDVTSIEPAMK